MIVASLIALRNRLDQAIELLSPIEDVLSALDLTVSAAPERAPEQPAISVPLDTPAPSGEPAAALEAAPAGFPGTCALPSCGKPFDGQTPRRMFCSDDCKREAMRVARKASRGKSRSFAALEPADRSRTASISPPCQTSPNGRFVCR